MDATQDAGELTIEEVAQRLGLSVVDAMLWEVRYLLIFCAAAAEEGLRPSEFDEFDDCDVPDDPLRPVRKPFATDAIGACGTQMGFFDLPPSECDTIPAGTRRGGAALASHTAGIRHAYPRGLRVVNIDPPRGIQSLNPA